MIAVFGSGFGLYGYLPALAGLAGRKVILPSRYRERFSKRSELAFFAGNIAWATSDADAIERAEEAVVALDPLHQPQKVADCLARPNIRRLIVEKPLASTEAEASSLLEELIESRRQLRIGYTLRFTPWAERLRARFATTLPSALAIDWRFQAHHFRHDVDTWKRSAEAGGGPVRFFGIHLLAVLAELGFDRVSRSSADDNRWSATLTGKGRSASIALDSRSPTDRFAVFADGAVIDGKEPFEETAPPARFPGNDRRVPVLHRLYCSFETDDAPEYAIYRRTQTLWRQVEAF